MVGNYDKISLIDFGEISDQLPGTQSCRNLLNKLLVTSDSAKNIHWATPRGADNNQIKLRLMNNSRQLIRTARP